MLFNNNVAAINTTTGFDLVAGTARIASLRPYVFLLDVGYIFMVLFAKDKLSNLIKDKTLLRDISLVWNSMNALFSFFVVALLLPECIYALFFRGWEYAVCTTGDFFTGRLSGFGMYIFTLSKIWELFDTVLLMLRGRPVIFLHYYHHALVLFQVIFTYPDTGSFARLATMMNAVVHSIMYSYFALATVSTSVRKYSKFVTVAQLLQFIIGCYGILYARGRINRGEFCETDSNQLPFHMFIYASFLTIFAHFFYTSFTKSRASSGKRKMK
uniref:Elongation of very long chain fatty acids protein n=1 Tax=Panagrolaimus sp. PS1159 TaxID=55785 RepID=A0AC35G5S0_9BILA